MSAVGIHRFSDHPTSAQALLEISSHIQEQGISFFTLNEECEPSTACSAHCIPSSSTNDDSCTGLCMTFRDISPNALSEQLDDDEQLPERYGPKARAVILRVGQFFDEMKSALGSSCEGTLFDTPILLTAAACGVPATVVMEAIKDKEQGCAFPTEQGPSMRTERMQRLAAMKRYGVEWGDQIRQCIRNRIESDAAVTIKDIHTDLKTAYPDFNLSVNILRRLVRGLGFSYTSQKGKRFIFERTEPSQSKFHQAQALANAIDEGECFERTKETWEVKGTMKKRGWVETSTDALRAAEGSAGAQEVGLEGTLVKRERKDEEQEDFLIFTEENCDAEFSDGFHSNKDTDEEDVYQGEELRADLLLPKEE
ncbi:unnamed protein product [Nippostrongylus brasiliensis]|uniref:HTH OST-type domain-containing protein n=1 Tax=Nippostrongylus brasiliensis TaxID=27835 RepID=A0A0N4YIW1_NIPBR|nr:unnamed protein product [Nippostrongylus brasiliensis]